MFYYRSGKSLTKSGMFMKFSEFMYMIRHPDFRDIVYNIWAFHPLTDDYSARAPNFVLGDTFEVGSLASGETDSEDDLEPIKKILKRKRVAELKQSSKGSPGVKEQPVNT